MRKLYSLLLLALSTISASAQWSEEPQKLLPDNFNIYSNEMDCGGKGTTWFFYYHPKGADEYDIPNVTYEIRLQGIAPDGTMKFDDEGLLISSYLNRSYTVVSRWLMADRDDNAILAVTDARNCPPENGPTAMSYSAYKVSPEGEQLWGEDGVDLTDGHSYPMAVSMNMTQLSDGSYVFAWAYQPNESESRFAIAMQRVSADGKKLWKLEETTLSDAKNTYIYPYVVDAGDNQVILVYVAGANQDIYARKIDFDGSCVWGKDLRIYRGGFGSIPVWTLLSVTPSGDGGALVSWNDDRAYTNIESAYVSYVTPDGKLGFAGASDEGDVKVGYSGERGFQVNTIADPDGDGFIVIWRETSYNQSYQTVCAQRLSKSGELLWGDNGVELVPYEKGAVGYLQLFPAAKGEVMAKFMRQIEREVANSEYRPYYETHLKPLNIKTGKPILADDHIVAVEGFTAQKVEMVYNAAQKSYIGWWESYDYDPVAETKTTYHHTQSFSYVSPNAGIVDVSAEATTLAYDGTCFSGIAPESTVEVFTLSGIKVATVTGKAPQWSTPTAGCYVARETASSNAIKIITK